MLKLDHTLTYLQQLPFYVDVYRADEVQAIVSGKLALKYAGPNIEAMKSIAQASHKRSLADFQKVSCVTWQIFSHFGKRKKYFQWIMHGAIVRMIYLFS